MEFATHMTGKIRSKANAMITCEECGREFQRNRKADLQRHMRIHTNEKPYHCEFPGCGKAFRQSSALKNHGNFHTKEKPYKCDLCDQTFFDKPTCNRHKREKHELSYVYRCTTTSCEKMFKRKSVFKKHLADRHNVYYEDADLNRYRVPAEMFMKASSNGSSRSSRSTASNGLPRLSEALRDVRSPAMSGTVLSPNAYYSSSPSMYAAGGPNPVLLSNPYAANSYGQTANRGYPMYSGRNTNDMWLPASEPQNGACYYGQTYAATGHPSAFLGVGIASSSYSPVSSAHSLSPNSSFLTSSGDSSGSSGSYSPNSSFSRSGSVSPINTGQDLLGGPQQYLLKPATDYNPNAGYLLTGTPY